MENISESTVTHYTHMNLSSLYAYRHAASGNGVGAHHLGINLFGVLVFYCIRESQYNSARSNKEKEEPEQLHRNFLTSELTTKDSPTFCIGSVRCAIERMK